PLYCDVGFRGECQQFFCVESWCYDVEPHLPDNRHSELATSSANAQRGALWTRVASSRRLDSSGAKTTQTLHAGHELPTQHDRKDATIFLSRSEARRVGKKLRSVGRRAG